MDEVLGVLDSDRQTDKRGRDAERETSSLGDTLRTEREDGSIGQREKEGSDDGEKG